MASTRRAFAAFWGQPYSFLVSYCGASCLQSGFACYGRLTGVFFATWCSGNTATLCEALPRHVRLLSVHTNTRQPASLAQRTQQ